MGSQYFHAFPAKQNQLHEHISNSKPWLEQMGQDPLQGCSSTPTTRSTPKQILLAPQIPCYFCSLVFPIDLRAKVNYSCGSLLVLFNLGYKMRFVPPGSVPSWEMHQLLPLLQLHFKEAWISKRAVRDYILEGEIIGH